MYNLVIVSPAITRSNLGGAGRLARILRIPLVRAALLATSIPALGRLHGLYAHNVEPLLSDAWVIWVNGLEKLLMIFVAVVTYRLLIRLIERRAAYELGGRDGLKEFGIGFGFSGMMIATCVLLIAIFGSYQVTGLNPPGILVYAFVTTAFYALLEDLLFRAIIFRAMEEWLGSWLAIALVAGLFGLSHYGNENASVSSSVALAVGDLSLAAAFVLTRRIWMVWGVHVGWNFFQEKIFGMPNSGFAASQNLIDAGISGPSWVTGGAFGVENSIPGVLTSVAVGALLMYWAYQKKQVVAPAWM